LIELVEIYSRSESKRMRNSLRRRGIPRPRLLAKAGTERPIDYFPERQSEFARAPLQQCGKIVIDGESGAH